MNKPSNKFKKIIVCMFFTFFMQSMEEKWQVEVVELTPEKPSDSCETLEHISSLTMDKLFNELCPEKITDLTSVESIEKQNIANNQSEKEYLLDPAMTLFLQQHNIFTDIRKIFQLHKQPKLCKENPHPTRCSAIQPHKQPKLYKGSLRSTHHYTTRWRTRLKTPCPIPSCEKLFFNEETYAYKQHIRNGHSPLDFIVYDVNPSTGKIINIIHLLH